MKSVGGVDLSSPLLPQQTTAWSEARIPQECRSVESNKMSGAVDFEDMKENVPPLAMVASGVFESVSLT